VSRIDEIRVLAGVLAFAALGAVIALIAVPAAGVYTVSRLDITYAVAAACGMTAVVAFVGVILVPAIGGYTRTRDRLVATMLSFYVLAAVIGLGLLAAAGVVWVWGRYG
jgi:hypothetical protein